jgi:hypothetical protein
VHVPRLATDEGFIGFDVTRHHVFKRSLVEREPDAVIHEPRGLLSDPEIAVDFV